MTKAPLDSAKLSFITQLGRLQYFEWPGDCKMRRNRGTIFMFRVPCRWYYRGATGAQRRTTRQTLRRTIRMRKGITILLFWMLALSAPSAANRLCGQAEKKDALPD